MPVLVRYFAGARAAAGVAEEKVEAATLAALVAELGARHGPGLARVLTACSFLVDEISAQAGDVELADGATVDVLPPFAGG